MGRNAREAIDFPPFFAGRKVDFLTASTAASVNP
jgi:hypothetical protein